MYSFDGYMRCIETPAKALGSLLQQGALDSEAREIVRALMRLRSQYFDANNRKRTGKEEKEVGV